MKKKILTILSIVMCAMLLVVGSVAGTIAWLTSQVQVDNTFTVGDVVITMDEVNQNGEGRVNANAYKLIPGKTYTNGLTIHVATGSEECYIFAKIPANAEISYAMAAGWTRLDGTTDVWVYSSTATAGQDIPVMTSFSVENTATKATLDSVTTPIQFIGYAVQAEGFNSAAAAWTAAGFGN